MADLLVDHNTSMADIDTSKQVGELLWNHYPGYLWKVRAMHSQGVVVIYNDTLTQDLAKMNPKYANLGMILKLKDYATPSERDKDIIRMAGEFLERACMVRGHYNGAHITQIDGAEALVQ